MVGLSDGIFAIAIAMLLIASNVPTTFAELLEFVYDIPAFGICIIFIYWIWTEQNRIFQLYNIFDKKMNVLNMFLLFFVLVYVYPLKFLMQWIFRFFGSLFSGNIKVEFAALNEIMPMRSLPLLMVIYGIGFICIFSCLYLMHLHALQKVEEIGLTEAEILKTSFLKKQLFHSVAIGILSVLCALVGIIFDLPQSVFFSGIVYNLTWVTSIFNSKKYKSKLAELNAN